MRQLYHIFTFVLIALFCTSCHSSKGSVTASISNKEKTFRLSAKERREGFKILFDGVSMDQWIDNTDQYVVENGCIVMQPKTRYGGNLYSKEEYENFIFRFEFMLTPGANSGVGTRHKIVNTPKGYDGIELQILDDYDPKYKDLEPYQFHGSLYGWVPAKTGYLKPSGEWNYQEVTMNKNQLHVVLNGTLIMKADFDELIKNAPEGKNISKLQYKKGHIAFLGHGDIIKFRNIRVKGL